MRCRQSHTGDDLGAQPDVGVGGAGRPRGQLECIESGDLSQGMQNRIARSVAGEQLPGYYPLGQAPLPIW